MKLKYIDIVKYSFLATLLVFLVFTGCKDKEDLGLPPTLDLTSLISQAENLISTSKEGTSPGNFKPGSKQTLQDVLTWVDWQLANATDQSEIDKAAVRLKKYIDEFKVNTVKLAIPLFNNTPNSWIIISDNIKPLFSKAFTLEFETYYLGPTGWIQNIISMEDGDASGLTVRYFSGNLDFVIGNGGWAVNSAAGAFKVGEWVHYAVTSDGTNWKVYMNGSLVLSLEAPGMKPNSKSLLIGNGPAWTDRAYNGMIKDFRVWSSIKDVAQLYASKDVALKGDETDLKVYFPLDADLGTEFKDNTGNYTAKFVGTGVAWAPDGIPPVINLDFTSLDAAISKVSSFIGTVVEGKNNGDYPIGTKEYLQSVVTSATDFKKTAEKQTQIDSKTTEISDKLDLVQSMLVADANGIYVDREDPNAVGLRITPNYTPQGDYTVEFDLKIKTLFMKSGNSGEIFGNGSFGLRIFGYNDLTEEGLLSAGGLWNFTNANNAWEGPQAPALTMKSKIWQHVAIVHDQTAKTTIIYVEGKEVGKSVDFGHPLNSDWGEIWLGNSWGSKMNGTIKDFRIWDAVKAPSELNANINGTESKLRIYFPLDKVAGLSFKDVTGNFNAELRGVKWEK